MGSKQKVVFNADATDLEQVQRLIAAKAYPSISVFLREAMAEKLARLRRRRVAEEVARYCAAGHADEDEDLISRQSFDEEPAGKARQRRRRAQR